MKLDIKNTGNIFSPLIAKQSAFTLLVFGFFNLIGYGIERPVCGKAKEKINSEGNRSLGTLPPSYHETAHHPGQKHFRLHLHCCVCSSSGASDGGVLHNLTPQPVITLLVLSLKYSRAIYSYLVLPTLSCGVRLVIGFASSAMAQGRADWQPVFLQRPLC